jgi:DNA-binding transcriptional ArsR family regulator
VTKVTTTEDESETLTELTTNYDELVALAEPLSAGGHETRMRILLAARDLGRSGKEKFSPASLEKPTGETLNRLSYHVKILAKAGLLEARGGRPVRGAYEHFYTLSPHGDRLVAIIEMLGWMERCEWKSPPPRAAT